HSLNICLWQEAVLFKLTNAVCESYNKSWLIVNTCRLRAISRNKTVLNVNVSMVHPCSNIFIDVQFFKRANGYKPWLIKFTVDACRFLNKLYNPAAILIYRQLKEFSNLNHTCPYVGNQIIEGFYLRPEKLLLPLPTGDYLLEMTWFLDNKKVLITNVYFTFTDDL
ncbi:hypothetical protein KR044_003152, partial [Drosophila immigrans]